MIVSFINEKWIILLQGEEKMLQKKTKHFITSWAIFALFMGLFSIGCVRAVPLYIAHEPLNPVGNKKDGRILIKQFVNKVESGGGPIFMVGVSEEQKRQNEKWKESQRASMGMLITSFFAEALEEAGYQVVFQEEQPTKSQNHAKIDAIIAGEIWGFNFEGGKKSFAFYSKLWVKVEALDPANQKVLWRKQFIGEEKSLNWTGEVVEFNRVIRQAATKALNQAATEFASEEFYRVVKKEANKKNDSKQQRQYKR